MPPTQFNTQAQLALNPAARQFVAAPSGIPYNNPYFEMNNLRYQMSGLGGYGACPGNPFLTPHHFAQPVKTNLVAPYSKPDQKNVQTNTTLQLKTETVKSRDKGTLLREQGTETKLVLGARKRNRNQRPPAKRPNVSSLRNTILLGRVVDC